MFGKQKVRIESGFLEEKEGTMLRKRLAVVTVSAIVLGGAAVATPLLVSGGVAGAVLGTTHTASVFTNGAAKFTIEGKASVRFTCSATTGVFSLKVRNLNVVDFSGRSYVDDDTTLDVSVGISSATTASITQNTVTGLWQTTIAGVLQHTTDCQSGSNVDVVDDLTGGSGIELYGPMS
jgi:hypothetical protein